MFQRHAYFQNVSDNDADDDEGHGDERGCGSRVQIAAMHLPHDHDGGEQVKSEVSIHGALSESDGYECEPAIGEREKQEAQHREGEDRCAHAGPELGCVVISGKGNAEDATRDDGSDIAGEELVVAQGNNATRHGMGHAENEPVSCTV